MTKTQNPNDPDSLTLTPSGGGAKKPDFSNVQGSADTVPGKSGGSGGGSAGGASGRPDFSNVQGSADTVPGNAGATAEQTYTVQKGDTLSHISQQFYGKASRWNRIFEANRDQLDDPDLIKPGQVLKIPQADA